LHLSRLMNCFQKTGAQITKIFLQNAQSGYFSSQ